MRLAFTSPALLFFASASVALALGGCHTHAIDDRADAQLTEIYASGERAAIYPSCPDHAPIGANCGLYSKRAATEEFRTHFRDASCIGRSDDECQALYQRALDGWMERRYQFADFHAVARSCDTNPGHCDDPVSYELMLLDSHNKAVRDGVARAENDVEAERRHAHHEDADQAISTAGFVAQTAALALASPRCRTYPSILGGVTTVCDR